MVTWLTGMKKKHDELKFCGFFASVFNNIDRPWAAWFPKQEVHRCGSSGFPFVDTNIVRGHLNQLNVLQVMEPGSH